MLYDDELPLIVWLASYPIKVIKTLLCISYYYLIEIYFRFF